MKLGIFAGSSVWAILVGVAFVPVGRADFPGDRVLGPCRAALNTGHPWRENPPADTQPAPLVYNGKIVAKGLILATQGEFAYVQNGKDGAIYKLPLSTRRDRMFKGGERKVPSFGFDLPQSLDTYASNTDAVRDYIKSAFKQEAARICQDGNEFFANKQNEKAQQEAHLKRNCSRMRGMNSKCNEIKKSYGKIMSEIQFRRELHKRINNSCGPMVKDTGCDKLESAIGSADAVKKAGFGSPTKSMGSGLAH